MMAKWLHCSWWQSRCQTESYIAFSNKQIEKINRPKVEFDDSFKKNDGVGYRNYSCKYSIYQMIEWNFHLFTNKRNILKGNQGILNLQADAVQ